MDKGAIILVRFPFTDYTSTKLRPALIISTNNQSDVCVAFISSVIPFPLEESDYFLSKDNPNFSLTGLRKESVFKMRKIATIDSNLVVGKLGILSGGLLQIMNQKLRAGLGLL